MKNISNTVNNGISISITKSFESNLKKRIGGFLIPIQNKINKNISLNLFHEVWQKIRSPHGQS